MKKEGRVNEETEKEERKEQGGNEDRKEGRKGMNIRRWRE